MCIFFSLCFLGCLLFVLRKLSSTRYLCVCLFCILSHLMFLMLMFLFDASHLDLHILCIYLNFRTKLSAGKRIKSKGFVDTFTTLVLFFFFCYCSLVGIFIRKRHKLLVLLFGTGLWICAQHYCIRTTTTKN